ncbi:pseudouridine synthase [Treponema zioleckii]|uniref:pseudouridine synthase n=1 Tax=Treponema zioleckii TaxID=331680 RepID=UPI00168B53E9|nr:RNA pseudouridine synthase [Treponema zioleckii]
MNDLKIIHEPTGREPFIVVDKPASLPSAPLKIDDDSLLTRILNIFPEVKNVRGKKEIEYGLVHRIDNETRGLVLIASSQDFYDFIIESQKNNLFEKTYSAKIQRDSENPKKLGGFPENQPKINFYGENIVRSRFRPFGTKNSQVRPVTEESGRAALKKCGETVYTTCVKFIGSEEAECRITNGYRHQVRCHLAWLGCPVFGDRLYNSNFNEGERLLFVAKKISFPDLFSKKTFSFELNDF